MAVRCRATFFFKDTNDHGWSETIFSLAPDLTTCMEKASALAEVRRNLLGNTAALVFIRVSDDLVKRDSVIKQIPVDDQMSRTATGAADIANTCLVVRVVASPTVRRTLYMRGVPDTVIQDSGKFVPTAAFRNSFDDWSGMLAVDSWACRTVDNTIVPGPITNVVWDPVTALATITTLNPHGLALTDVAVIRGVLGAVQVNGSWPIFSIPTDSSIRIKTKNIVGTYAGQGSLSKSAFLLFPIISAEVRRVSHRIAGRPFDSPVGRRRARARA